MSVQDCSWVALLDMSFSVRPSSVSLGLVFGLIDARGFVKARDGSVVQI